jgi:hypothetical protein
MTTWLAAIVTNSWAADCTLLTYNGAGAKADPQPLSSCTTTRLLQHYLSEEPGPTNNLTQAPNERTQPTFPRNIPNYFRP